MGLWNAILNLLLCAAIIVMVISGVVMWWMRRPANAVGLAAPPLPQRLPFWKGEVLIMPGLSLAFPLVGLTLLVLWACDFLVLSRIPALSRVFA